MINYRTYAVCIVLGAVVGGLVGALLPGLMVGVGIAIGSGVGASIGICTSGFAASSTRRGGKRKRSG